MRQETFEEYPKKGQQKLVDQTLLLLNIEN